MTTIHVASLVIIAAGILLFAAVGSYLQLRRILHKATD